MEEVKIAVERHASEPVWRGIARTYRLSPTARARHRTARRVIAAELTTIAAIVALISVLI